jgi:hypothetical protein
MFQMVGFSIAFSLLPSREDRHVCIPVKSAILFNYHCERQMEIGDGEQGDQERLGTRLRVKA